MSCITLVGSLVSVWLFTFLNLEHFHETGVVHEKLAVGQAESWVIKPAIVVSDHLSEHFPELYFFGVLLLRLFKPNSCKWLKKPHDKSKTGFEAPAPQFLLLISFSSLSEKICSTMVANLLSLDCRAFQTPAWFHFDIRARYSLPPILKISFPDNSASESASNTLLIGKIKIKKYFCHPQLP